jgi:hypothetical protein
LDVSGSGYHEQVSFASANGTAMFTMTIANSGDAGYDAVQVSAQMNDPEWPAELVNFTIQSTGDYSQGMMDLGTLGAGGSAVLAVDVSVPFGSDVGKQTEVTITVGADGDSADQQFTVTVTNWIAWSDDVAVHSFEVGGAHDYSLTVENIAVDENGTAVAIADDITVQYAGIGGWRVSGSDWDPGTQSMVLHGMDAGLAYECFKKALQLQPDDPYVLATAGNGVALFDDPDAMEALKSAALLAPDLPLTRMLYGAYLAREGFHDWAVEQLEAEQGFANRGARGAHAFGDFVFAEAVAGQQPEIEDVFLQLPVDALGQVFAAAALEPDLHAALSVSITTTGSPALITVPGLQCSPVTVPATLAVISNSIFMASTITRVWPASTLAPSSTSSFQTLPLISALTRWPSTSPMSALLPINADSICSSSFCQRVTSSR